HVIARPEVLVPLRVELVEVGKECEEIINNRVDTPIDAPVGESLGNIILEVIRQQRFESIHVSLGVVQLPDESDLRRIRHANLPLMLMAHSSLRLMLMAHSRATPLLIGVTRGRNRFGCSQLGSRGSRRRVTYAFPNSGGSG